MNLIVTLFAATSAALALAIFYYNLMIVRKFQEDEKLTATKLVIKEQVPDAFMVLSISALFFSLGAFLGAGTLIVEMSLFEYFSELGILTMMVGLLTFMKRIAEAVTEGEETELEDEERESEEKASEDEDNSDGESEEDEDDD
ncbi:MAG: hypothetical protein ABEK04_04575 [Candidatus Nanohalobium sp.]